MKNIKKFRYIVTFIILIFLCWMFPYTGDDWAWGSSIGIERLNTWFDNYSGRYVGNLIVLALTRSNLLKTITMAFMLTGIIYFVEKLTREKWTFYLSILLMIFLPKAIFRQAIVWTAGFSNYVTSVFFTLIYVVYFYKIFDGEKPKQRYLHCIPLGILGVINTLIVEHLTIYNVIMAMGVIIYTFIKYKKIIIQYVMYFIGTIVGTCYMFSNSVYHSISQNADGYRTMSSKGLIGQALINYFDVMYKEMYMNNLVLNGILVIICIILYGYLRKKERKNNLIQGCLWVMTVYEIYAIFSVLGLVETTKGKHLIYLEGVATLISAAAVIIVTVWIGIKLKQWIKIVFSLCSIICLGGPLLEVTPIGSRCFFATYVFFMILICELVRLLPEDCKEKVVGYQFRKVCTCIVLTGMCFYLGIFLSIYKADRHRLNYIECKIAEGEKKIDIIHLPYESYVWTPTPGKGDIWEERYKLFYHLPADIQLNPVWSYTK